MIDYSLLIVVEQISSKVQTAYRLENLSRNEFKSHDNSLIYHVGIIDFLARFGTSKKIEGLYKTAILGQKRKNISCVDPIFYRDRFLKFFKKEVLYCNLTGDAEIITDDEAEEDL